MTSTSYTGGDSEQSFPINLFYAIQSFLFQAEEFYYIQLFIVWKFFISWLILTDLLRAFSSSALSL